VPGIGVDEVFRVGGFMFSRTSVQTLVDGVPYTGIVEVNGEEAREGEIVPGQRTDAPPLGITTGLFMPGAFTFKTYIDTGEMICEQLSVLGLGSFGNYQFPFILEIFENRLLPSLAFLWSNVKIEKRKFALPTDARGAALRVRMQARGHVDRRRRHRAQGNGAGSFELLGRSEWVRFSTQSHPRHCRTRRGSPIRRL
jgi:hypothetical protein